MASGQDMALSTRLPTCKGAMAAYRDTAKRTADTAAHHMPKRPRASMTLWYLERAALWDLAFLVQRSR